MIITMSLFGAVAGCVLLLAEKHHPCLFRTEVGFLALLR